VPAATAVESGRAPGGEDPNRHRRFVRRHRRAIAFAIGAAAIAGFIIFVVPQIGGLAPTLRRLRHANLWWIGLALILESVSLGGYALLFRTVFSSQGVRIGWRESFQITLAGTVASKLLAAAGAGGVALTVWALRASGLRPSVVARRMLAFELLLYAVFAGALLIVGAGLRAGIFAGRAPWTLTVVPAILSGGVIVAVVSLRALPADFQHRIERLAGSSGRTGRVLSRLASAPQALRDATTIVIELIRDRDAGLVGAVAYWAFDIATLWACLHAFGTPPAAAPIVMAYFVGQLANVLPLPGGVGGVEGGTIAALIAFGAPGSVALLGVLAYRLISFWLPTLPGGVAYVRLRRTVAGWRREPAA
jgi:uncharacterized protein (TIRG00374 family)